MMEVRIRHESEVHAAHLCQWPATDLDSIIPTLKRWGVVTRDSDADPFEDGFVGQFVVEDREAFFEVVIVDDDE